MLWRLTLNREVGQEVKKTQSWTRLAVPVALLSAGVALTSIAAPKERAAHERQRELAGQQQRFETLRLLVDVRGATNQLLTAQWQTTLDRDADLVTRYNDLDDALAALESGPAATADFVMPRLSAINLTRATKADMAAIGGVERAIGEATYELGRDLDHPELSATSDLIFGASMTHQFITATRIVNEIDPPSSDPEAQAYVEGSVSGYAIPASPPTRLDKMLTPYADFGDEDLVGGLLNDPMIAAWAAQAQWALAGGSAEVDAPPAADLDAAAAVLIEDLHRFSTDAIADRQVESRRVVADASQIVRRWQLAVLLGALGAIGGLLWGTIRLRRTLQTLRRAAEIDTLTGLANRAGLRTRTEPWFAASRPAAVGISVVDLDHFKSVNDRFGHQVGDQLLGVLATRLTDNVVYASTSVGRWGGDEFVIVFKLMSTDELDATARLNERLKRSLSEPIDLGEAMITATASIGSAVCLCGDCDFEDLFRDADHRLYDVKRAHRNDVSAGACRRSALADVSSSVTTATTGSIP